MKSVHGKKSTMKHGDMPRMELRGMNGSPGVISLMRQPSAPRQGMEPMLAPPPEPVETHHPTMAHLTDHIAKHMGHMFGKADAKSSAGGRVPDPANKMDLPAGAGKGQ